MPNDDLVRVLQQNLHGIEIGSNSAKLVVDSVIPSMPTAMREERVCSTKLGFGVKVFNATTGDMKPLSSEDLDALVATITEYKRICALDGGTIVGATPGAPAMRLTVEGSSWGGSAGWTRSLAKPASSLTVGSFISSSTSDQFGSVSPLGMSLAVGAAVPEGSNVG